MHPLHRRSHQSDLAFAVACSRSCDHPRTVLADIGHLEEERVQPAFGACPPEGRFVHQRGAGGHHHPVQAEIR